MPPLTGFRLPSTWPQDPLVSQLHKHMQTHLSSSWPRPTASTGAGPQISCSPQSLGPPGPSSSQLADLVVSPVSSPELGQLQYLAPNSLSLLARCSSLMSVHADISTHTMPVHPRLSSCWLPDTQSIWPTFPLPLLALRYPHTPGHRTESPLQEISQVFNNKKRQTGQPQDMVRYTHWPAPVYRSPALFRHLSLYFPTFFPPLVQSPNAFTLRPTMSPGQWLPVCEMPGMLLPLHPYVTCPLASGAEVPLEQLVAGSQGGDWCPWLGH